MFAKIHTLVVGCLSFLRHGQISSVEPHRFPATLGEIRVETPTKQAVMLGEMLIVLSGFFFPLEELESQGAPLHMYCAGLGKGQCGQCVPAPLTLLIPSVLVFVVQRGVLALPPCPWILAVVSYS